MPDDISLFWFTNCATSSTQRHWKINANNVNTVYISISTAIAAFPARSIVCHEAGSAGHSYHRLIYFKDVTRALALPNGSSRTRQFGNALQSLGHYANVSLYPG